MNAHRFHVLISIMTLVCFLVAWSLPADAQKKSKAKTQTKEQPQTKEASTEQPKEEQKEKVEAKAEEPAAAPAPAPGTMPNKFVDVLKQHIGEKTNLGTLKKFAGDYVIFEDELTTVLVPLSSIQSAKLVKDDETSPAQLEIKLISKD